MDQPPYKRRILVINRDVQLKIIGFGSLSALAGTLYASFVARLTFPHMLVGEELPRSASILIMGGGIALFAFAMVIGMYLSNRIAGPLHRLHRGIKALADGEPTEPIRGSRRGDLYQDLIQDYNRLVERVNGPKPGP